MGLAEAIMHAQAALEELKNGSYDIITRSTPSTWGDMQAWLEEELARIQTEGGIDVNPPEVILPDGVTSSSLVSQSEMTQFVTNTLNTWAASLQPGYDLDSFIVPEIKHLIALTYTNNKNNHFMDASGYEKTVIFNNLKVIGRYIFGYYTNEIYGGRYFLGEPLLVQSLEGGDLHEDDYPQHDDVIPLTAFYGSKVNLYGCFIDGELNADLSNFNDLVDYTKIAQSGNTAVLGAQPLMAGAYVYTDDQDVRDHTKMLRVVNYIWDSNNIDYYSVVDKKGLVIFLQFGDMGEVIPLFEMIRATPFIDSGTVPSGAAAFRIPIGLLYPRKYSYNNLIP